ncbi:MAG TPA: glutamate--tRNA ligase [Pyrinomonadaceae bacterium]|nr:glutamate--tRNA ligase [Pyrinomonadaceae bacterium]
MTVRVRFAPSPTGYLHLGAARAALYNYLYARQTGGKFLLRIEDTDLARSTDESTRSILEGLEWLGLQHDEDVVFQSDNADKHRAIAKKLLAEGKAYRDFTPKEETSDKTVKEAIVERARQTDKNMRDNRFRDLSAEESDARAVGGESFAIRLKVAESGKTVFEDGVYGLQEREYSDTEDLVLLRSDGHPLYNLAVVCDDIEMGITHVIRGQDHLTNTHKQILIYEALGAKPPTFAHLPLILAPNKGKLSKRKHGEVVSLTTYRDAGFIPAAFRNFLALMGWSAGEEKEIYSLNELVEKFSLDHIHRSNAVFNFQEHDPRHWTDDKALWMNAEYIRTMPLDELLPIVKAELKSSKLWRDEYEDDDREWFERTIELIRHRFFTLKDFSNQGRAYFSEDYDFDSAAIAKNLTKFPDLRQWLPELAARFEPMESFAEPEIETAVKAFTEEKGTKLGVIMNGARTLLTGVAVGPSMLSVFETLGKEKTIMRLRSQVAWNEKENE